MRIDPDRLRGLRGTEDVLEFLAHDLDWPIDVADLDEATFEYEPTELGLPPERVPQLRAIRQLRPLTVHQPWGIFFLEFHGPRLPVTPLRRLLHRLVATKRAARAQRTWDLADLLFVITTDSPDSVEFCLVTFVDRHDGPAEIRPLAWRPEHSPRQHLLRLAWELLPRLEWPDDPDDADGWRRAWHEAFPLRHGEPIRSAAHLAERMADVAVELRKAIGDTLRREPDDGPFHGLLAEVRAQLVDDLDDAGFADMCAQTLTYGTLAARVADPEGFGASPILTTVPLANPFLAAFFEQVHDQVADLDLERAGLEPLVADLRATNVEAILDQFGSTAKGGDPVVHFYEEFLKRYDRKQRLDAGAVYTPQPVVAFMVRAVDEVLRSSFGLPGGIADSATWREVADRLGVEVPTGVDPDARFVSMIDPATGTGTFLVEWIRRARTAVAERDRDAAWPQRLAEVVLPAMHAFELMPAPYTIAHLKVALEAHTQGVDPGEVAIHLTDTLAHPADQGTLDLGDDPVAAEGARAAALKIGERFTVCIGNPPYDREQRDVGDRGRRKGGVVRHGAPGIPPLLESVIAPMRAAGLGVHVKNLYNDYVYFWRWATWQTTERIPGPGAVAFITASSYLDGRSMGGLRAHLRDRFDELWIVDLGGDSRGARTEENVFDIRTPVAIALGVRTRGGPGCAVRYARVRGSRAEKLAWLGAAQLGSVHWDEVSGEGLDSFVPRSPSEYWTWPAITDLFPWVHSGAQYKRTWPIAPSRSVLERRWREFRRLSGRARREAFKETRDRRLTTVVPSLFDPAVKLPPLTRAEDTEVAPYGYRSFDREWALADPRLGDFLRPPLWRAWGPRQVFLTTLTGTKFGRGPVAMASTYVPDLCHFRGSFGAKDTVPLYRNPDATEPNVTARLLDVLADAYARPVTAEDLVAYVYGLTGTPAFADRFDAELAERAGPVRIPLTADPDLFERVLRLGRDLLWWHTFGERFAPPGDPGLPPGPAREVAPVRGMPDDAGYDPATRTLAVGTGRFAPVPEAVWDFEVSGMRVLRSWLGRRMATPRGRTSSPLDEIRPQRWTFTDELLRVIAILDHTVEVTPRAQELLAAVVAGPLLDPASLPTPTPAQRKPPRE